MDYLVKKRTDLPLFQFEKEHLPYKQTYIPWNIILLNKNYSLSEISMFTMNQGKNSRI